MNFMVDIFIRETDLKVIGITEVFAEWGGEIFSRTPQQYEYQSNLIFERNIDTKYYKKHYEKLIGDDFDMDSCLSLHLLGEHMSDLVALVNLHPEQLPENPMIEFMDALIKSPVFAIFIEDEDDERIHQKKIVHSYKELIDILCYNLNWDVSQGILLIKKDDMQA